MSDSPLDHELTPLMSSPQDQAPQPTYDSQEIRKILEKRKPEILRLHLETHKQRISVHTKNKALKGSIQLGDAAMVNILLDHGADPNGMVEFQPVWEFAIALKQPDIFVDLWEAGAEVVYNEERVPKFLTLMKDLHKLVHWLMRVDPISWSSSHEENQQQTSEIFPEQMLETWLQIIQNDNVEQLSRFHESGRWNVEKPPSFTFDVAQCVPSEKFLKMFENCHENGLGISTAVKQKYLAITKKGDFRTLLYELSRIKSIRDVDPKQDVSIQIDDVIIFPSFENSVLLLALLSGRLQVVEALVRMRQFDILPCALFVCLLTRGLQKLPHLPDQTKNRLEKFAEILEGIATDALSRMSLQDNKVILSILEVPIKTFGDLTVMDLADKAECCTVLSSACCQTVLQNQWKGATAADKNCCQIENPPCSKLFSTLCFPRCKCCIHSLIHFIFVVCFSLVLLRNFHSSPSCLEYICMVYVFGYFVETVRMALLTAADRNGGGWWTVMRKLRFWLDVLAIGLTAAGFIWRWFWNKEDTELFYSCRVVLLTGLLLFYLRVLPILTINSVLGPRLTMMKNMLVKDLLPLTMVFTVFILAFGVVVQSLLYPNGKGRNNSTELSYGETFYFLFRRTFYGMLAAEYPLEELEGECKENQTCPHPLGSDLVLFGYHAAFVFAVNISLINLLIALFSNTVANIAAKSRAHWLAKSYDLVREYQRHSWLPPPFNCISCAIDLVQSCYRPRSSPTQQDDEKEEQENRNDMWKRYLLVQAFALRKQRAHLGNVDRDLQMKQIESEVNELRREIRTLSDIVQGKRRAEVLAT